MAPIIFGVLMTQSFGGVPQLWPDMFVAALLIVGGVFLFIYGMARKGRN